MRGRANRGQYSTRRHIALQTIENMLHVHALLSSSMNRPATKYNSLPSKSQGAKIVDVGRYGRNGKAIEQRLDQQRRAEAAAAARRAAHAAE